MNSQFKQKIIQVSNRGQSVCDVLERGQAETPLSEHFRQIERDLDNSPFSMVLLGLTTEARTAVLAWLYGKDFSVLSVNVVKQLGLVEINLRERGYTLERADGDKQEFDQLAPFMDALEQSDLLKTFDGKDWVDPIRLGVNSAKGLQSLKVYMPESPNMILENPGLLNRVATQANLLVVAAPLHYELTETDQTAIKEISQNMDGFWPLLVVDELEEETSLPNIGWWQQHKAPTVQLKPQLLTTHIDANIHGMLKDIEDDARQSLFLNLQAHRVIHASEAVEERCQQEIRQLQSRQKREQRKSQTNETRVKSGGVERHQWEVLRNQLNDEITKINKSTQDLGKKTLHTESGLITQIEQFVGQLQISDLDQEPGHKSIKLSVKEEFITELKNQLKVLLKRDLKAELSNISKTLNQKQQQFEEQVQVLTGEPQSFPMEAPDLKEMWESLKAQLSVNIRYRGEMPKRGFMTRLSDGRKAIMGISMMAMVVGGVFKAVWGIDFRSMIMLVAPLIFFGAIIYSYVVWPKEDAERYAKELDKVHDGLSSEIKRLLNDLQREKQSKLSDHLDAQKKSSQRKLEELNRETQSNQEKAIGSQRDESQKHLTQIDQQIRDLQKLERDIIALKRDCENLERDGKKQLKSLEV